MLMSLVFAGLAVIWMTQFLGSLREATKAQWLAGHRAGSFQQSWGNLENLLMLNARTAIEGELQTELDSLESDFVQMNATLSAAIAQNLSTVDSL